MSGKLFGIYISWSTVLRSILYKHTFISQFGQQIYCYNCLTCTRATCYNNSTLLEISHTLCSCFYDFLINHFLIIKHYEFLITFNQTLDRILKALRRSYTAVVNLIYKLSFIAFANRFLDEFTQFRNLTSCKERCIVYIFFILFLF